MTKQNLSPNASRPSMLYVEDDEVLATVIIKALTKRGFDIQHHTSLETAVSAARASNFDYGLLDLKLDSGLSLDLIPLLIDRNSDINILVLTGYASIATAVQAIKLGANNYLAKPATVDDILNAYQTKPEQLQHQKLETEKMSVRRLEWEHIQQALLENDGNISATARQLKMHRRTLQRKLQKKPVSQ